MGHADSVEKILGQIALLSPDTVTYTPRTPAGRLLKERVFDAPVNAVLITPSLFRKFTCTAGCTACCQKFTLDYTPNEFFTKYGDSRIGFAQREILVNGKKKVMWTNDQNHNPLCDFLTVEKPAGGLGCAQWPTPPLSCVSAPQAQFIQMRPGNTYVLKKPYGRAWAMTPTPQCTFEEVSDLDDAFLDDLISILDRFAGWAQYFRIRTCIKDIKAELKKAQKTHLIPTTGHIVWERT